MEDEIVISGISGRFPESANMNEFRDNLMDGINMVTVNSRRFRSGIYGIPEGMGTLKEVNKFDAEFFRVFPTQANRMDPQLRLTLETTFEAMLDAGVNPKEFRESRTGVFTGVCGSEASDMWNSQPTRVEGPTMTGCAHSMFANRVSFAFDFNGPSCAYDTACSSSIVALEAAVSAMKAGKCDSAVVTASTLNLSPHTTLQFNKLGMLAQDSACKSFDVKGDGYVRAEAAVTIFLQKRSVARRAYAVIAGVKTNTDGFKESGITSPSAALQAELMTEFYEETGINPDDVVYVEAHGTGTAVGDPLEFQSVSQIFEPNLKRRGIIHLGSVKSNMGHSEGASGLCGIAKILIALQRGVIPANLHFEKSHFNMKAIRDGEIKVVAENTELRPGLIALNSFGFGGVNGHLVLKPLEANNLASESTETSLPRLITVSGRTMTGVEETLQSVADSGDVNLYNLINDCHRGSIPGHPFRGYSLPESQFTHVDEANIDGSGGVWFVFNGFGGQWVGMGRDLMKIPAFAASIESSAQVLRTQFQYDLLGLLNSADEEALNTPTAVSVSIVGIQIGIVDVLSSIGVQATGFIGHSVGEIACAYADGCLTADEAITVAYLRGVSLKDAPADPTKEYGMAAIGDNWENVTKNCPPGVYAACHNGLNSVTVSGPIDLLDEYVAKVVSEEKNATKVNSCGTAFHSPYIEKASEVFLSSLKGLLKEPRARSKGWISTSIPKEEWSSELALKATPLYLANNFKSPVLFYEALQMLPVDTTIIEIGPSGLLKGLIKQAVPTAVVVPVQKRDSANALVDFISALGQMFIGKVDFDVNKLYGSVEYPVPIRTPMISPLVHWDHDLSWDVPRYGANGEFLEGVYEVELGKPTQKYLLGHRIQNRVLFPATGYLSVVWQHFAQMHQSNWETFPVVFEAVKLSRVTVLRTAGKSEFRVSISDSSGYFEIKESGSTIVSGRIRVPGDQMENTMHDTLFSQIEEKHFNIGEETSEDKDSPTFERRDIYKQLRFYGYEYTGLFKGIKSMQKVKEVGKACQVEWNGNWIAFLDTCLQTALGVFEDASTLAHLPTELEKVVIFPETLTNFVLNNKEVIAENGVFVLNDQAAGVIRCRGIEINGLRTTAISRPRIPEPTISPYTFCPYMDSEHSEKLGLDRAGVNMDPSVQFLTIVMENIKTINLNTLSHIIEFSRTPERTDSMQMAKFVRENLGVPSVTYTLYTDEFKEELADKYARAGISIQTYECVGRDVNAMEQKHDVVVIDSKFFIHIAKDLIREGSFIFCKLPAGTISRKKMVDKLDSRFTLICHRRTDTHEFFLAKKNVTYDRSNMKVIPVSTRNLDWVTTLRDTMVSFAELNKMPDPLPLIYLVSNGEEEEDSGILGLTLCLRREPFGQQLRTIFSRSRVPIDFANPSPLLAKLLAIDLNYVVVDVDGKTLGSYVHFPLKNFLSPMENVFLAIENPGDLSTLVWTQGREIESDSQYPGFVPVKVQVAALNFKDVMIASGNLQPEMTSHLPFNVLSPLGLEFAGTKSDGSRVIGFTEGQALATTVLGQVDTLWNIPEAWSFVEAATVPVVYSTVYLALIMRGQLLDGESILIHAGAGGVGIAAIRVALSKGCTVFTTVGSKEKLNFLLETFPEIPQAHIGNSRDKSFEQLVLRATGGRGVDLVLNSLAGGILEASVRCLARHGRFLEIGKVDLVANKGLGMSLFLKDASYHGVMLDSLWDARPSTRLRLNALIQEGIDSGVIQPLPHRSFAPDEIEPAFRYLAQAKHIGKVVISFESSLPPPIPAAPHVYFNPLKSYIVVGGLGGVGLEFVNWMVTRYANNIVLTSRSGVTTIYQKEYIRIWRKRGVNVKVLAVDAADPKIAELTVKEAMELGPLGGFFNIAMHLQVGFLKDQSKESFEAVFRPKVALTKNIDALTRKLCPELDHFVVFSSVASGIGYDGQSNYGQANSASERIVEKRVRDGLPGKAIQWGAIGGTGAWHDGYNAEFNVSSFRGFGVQGIHSVIKSLDVLITQPATVMCCQRVVEAGAGLAGDSSKLGVVDRVAHILGLRSSGRKLNTETKLTDLGMDSVTSTEVKQILEEDYNLVLTAFEIRGLTLKQLEEMSNNNPSFRITPKQSNPTSAIAGLFQLNFIKPLTKSRFIYTECVHPVNDLARERLKGDRTKGHPGGSIFVVNSIEAPEVLYLLAGLLPLPTYSMQMVSEPRMESMDEFTPYYFNQLKAIEPEGPYTIVGYSGGVFVGIELSLKLEGLAELNKYILLDMSPARFQALFKECFGTEAEEFDESDAVTKMMCQMLGLSSMEIEPIDNAIGEEENKQRRLKKISEILSDVFENAEQMEEFAHDRGKVAFRVFKNFTPSSKLSGHVILVKTTQKLISYDSTQYWGVDAFCERPPLVRIMDSTHSYLLTEPTVRLVANCINND